MTDSTGAAASIGFAAQIARTSSTELSRSEDPVVGQFYQRAMPVSDVADSSTGWSPYAWSATGLPPGFTITTNGGLITGTATTAGTYQVTVNVVDAIGATDSSSATWTVNP